jgi:iron complex transport system substrate-binding protein
VRIVSLLPSTTEILFAIGAGPDLVGVTFECDYPLDARSRTIVSTSALPPGLTPAEIDRYVSAALARGDDLYHLDRDALAELDADLVITQDLCAVCAVDVSVVDDALDFLGCRAEVVTIDPHTINEVLGSVQRLGEVTGHSRAAAELIGSLRQRLAAVAERIDPDVLRPRVVVLEWTDPPFSPGHWVPEMINRAGGESVLGTTGEPSRRTTWDAIGAAEPDVVVVAPCGYDRAGSQTLADDLIQRHLLPEGARVLPVDANASWARPGPRLIDGIEELADLLAKLATGTTRRARVDVTG